ncbi:hypothetical protein [Adoxophyes orana nucleopolyhedrovirus]|uniref:hypothetical protein n=1 Tax=Adoxophyes orana nucleopolyhedrovirus TaxID=542343 RepID=UPI0001829C27|nr:hypothetical protein [Adoxophyes orana nucleopolyhedrovirus]ACF05380.1 hypothetical protein [Adoxophyes orana nucleopolyhedrovirus]
MEAIRKQLFSSHTIPYISKKSVNDQLSKCMLKSLDEHFFNVLYTNFTKAVKHFCLVTGSFAIQSHLKRFDIEAAPLNLVKKLNLEVYLQNENLKADIITFETSINETIVCNIPVMEDGLKNVDCRNILNEIDSATLNDESLLVYKCYVNEAVRIDKIDDIFFEINRHSPFKTTTSQIDNDTLMRFSYNVHMKSKSQIWNITYNKMKRLTFIPMDIYFMDIIIKKGAFAIKAPPEFAFHIDSMFDTYVCIQNIEHTIADQLECLMYDTFNRVQSVKKRLETISRLISALPAINEDVDVRLDVYKTNFKYSIKQIKEILYNVGCRVGARIIGKLYFEGRFLNKIEDVTYQINFPHLIRNKNYFENCWKQYLTLLDKLFDIGIYC